VFEVGFDAPGGAEVRRMRFRIVLEPEARSGTRTVYDQRRRPSGWVRGDVGRMLYRAPRPLDDGTYRWRAEAWDGTAWTGGAGAFVLRIDSVPPAVVSGLRVDRDADRIVLRWDPVATDREGRPEYVARYHVYRHERASASRAVVVHEIGTTPAPTFVDDTHAETRGRILFYRVTAEDEAGNQGP
jgi:hypothetical protein